MIDSIAQTYHWSLAECMRLTTPQIIMLTQASMKNRDRFNEKYGTGDKSQAPKKRHTVPEEELFEGKPIDKLSSDEYMRYMRS